MKKISVVPVPRRVQAGDGAYPFDAQAEIRIGEGLSVECAEEFAALTHGFLLRCGRLNVVRDHLLAPFDAVMGAGADVALEKEDEYALAVSPVTGVRVSGRSESGLLHGLYTLLQMIIPVGTDGVERFELPEAEIHDHPRMGMRAMHLCLFPENTLLIIEKAIRLAAVMKYSHVVLEFWGTLQYDVLPELSWPGRSWSKQEIGRLTGIARRMGLEVIPMFNHLGHAAQSRAMYGRHVVLDQRPELQPLFEPDGWTWCVSNPETLKLLRAIREELMELCGPGEYFHLGCDEAYSFATCPKCCGQDGPRMLADYLNGLAEELALCGRRPIMWADALLDNTVWKSPVIATSRPDQRTHLALPMLDRRIVMADWQYDIKEPEVPSAKHFIDRGFDTVLCPWDGGGNIRSLGIAADRLNAAGIMVTTWHHLPEMMRLLNVGAEYAWNGAASDESFSPTGTAPLLRRVMPELPGYEEAGFNPFEVPQPDRRLMKSL